MNVIRYYEKYWNCPACGRKGISALRNMKCTSCGYNKTPQDQEYRSRIVITDSDGLELAKGGPHWTCSSCGTVNLDRYIECSSCGNPRERSDTTNKVINLGSNPPPEYDPPDQETQFYSQNEEFELPTNGNPLPAFSNNIADLPVMGKQKLVSNVPWRNISIGFLVILVLIVLGWLIFHTTDTQARIVGFSWVRNIYIESYQNFHESGWSSPPNGAYNESSETRYKESVPIYETIYESVPHPKTCNVDMGNGAEAEVDCSYNSLEPKIVQVGSKPIYETWYEYDIDRWVHSRTVHSEGDDREDVYWPEYTLKYNGQTIIGAERLSRKTEQYSIHFRSLDDKPKNYTYKVDDFNIWLKYDPEIKYLLKINHLNLITNNPLE